MQEIKRRIALFGASGFIGQELKRYFIARGYDLILFSRSRKKGFCFWNPEKKEIDCSLLQGVDVVINLSGEEVIGRWSKKKKERLIRSRVDSSRFLVDQLLHLSRKPKLYIGASAVGYYGVDREELLTERSEKGEGFLADLCKEWEESTKPLGSDMRLCHARFGIVLGKRGGALKKMMTPFKFGLGGEIGSGRQYISWIAIEDLVRGVEHLMIHEELEGAVNMTSPFPVTNHELTRFLARTLHRPAYFRLPEWLVRLFLGEAASLFLGSVKVMPERLLQSGFHFSHPHIEKIFC